MTFAASALDPWKLFVGPAVHRCTRQFLFAESKQLMLRRKLLRLLRSDVFVSQTKPQLSEWQGAENSSGLKPCLLFMMPSCFLFNALRSRQETSSIANITLIAFVFCAEKLNPEQPISGFRSIFHERLQLQCLLQLSSARHLVQQQVKPYSRSLEGTGRNWKIWRQRIGQRPMLENSHEQSTPTFVSEFVHLPPSKVEYVQYL